MGLDSRFFRGPRITVRKMKLDWLRGGDCGQIVMYQWFSPSFWVDSSRKLRRITPALSYYPPLSVAIPRIESHGSNPDSRRLNIQQTGYQRGLLCIALRSVQAKITPIGMLLHISYHINNELNATTESRFLIRSPSRDASRAAPHVKWTRRGTCFRLVN